MTTRRISLTAQIDAPEGPSLDPKRHNPEHAKTLASKLCETVVDHYYSEDGLRPETLAVGVQTALETLLNGFEREGVNTGALRAALANAMLSNGDAKVEINVDGEAEDAFDWKAPEQKPAPSAQARKKLKEFEASEEEGLDGPPDGAVLH